jgi:hypothetical protein
MNKLPQTSLEAYSLVNGKMLREQYVVILQSLKSIGSGIMQDIADHCKKESTFVSKRMKELEGMELVMKTGATKLTKSNRKANVYTLVDKNLDIPNLPNQPDLAPTSLDHASTLSAKAENTKKAVQKALGRMDIMQPSLF